MTEGVKWEVPVELAPYDSYTNYPTRAEELINSEESVLVNAPKAIMRAEMAAQYVLLRRLHGKGLLRMTVGERRRARGGFDETRQHLRELLGLDHLGSRASNVLARNGICTVEELARVPVDELTSLQLVGGKTLERIFSVREKLIDDGVVEARSALREDLRRALAHVEGCAYTDLELGDYDGHIGAVMAVLDKHGLLAEGKPDCKECGSKAVDWCTDCGACQAGCHGGGEGNLCSHPNVKWVR